MAGERVREDDDSTHQSKRPRKGFMVGPQNLPDGTWRRKVVKIKKDLIHKANIKKSYAKIKSRVPAINTPIRVSESDKARPQSAKCTQEIHPERQAMLDAPCERILPIQHRAPLERRRRYTTSYLDNAAAFAKPQKADAEAKRDDFKNRSRERQERTAERERFRKSMVKAKTGGRNGQRKLGRESKALLEKVKRAVEP